MDAIETSRTEAQFESQLPGLARGDARVDFVQASLEDIVTRHVVGYYDGMEIRMPTSDGEYGPVMEYSVRSIGSTTYYEWTTAYEGEEYLVSASVDSTPDRLTNSFIVKHIS